MPAKYPKLQLPRTDEPMDYIKFGKVICQAWEKSHPSIRLIALGTKLYENDYPVITYHIQRRVASESTPKPRVTQSYINVETETDLNDVETEVETELITFRQDFENEIVFTIHVPVNKGGGEVADQLCEEFERFMLEHTGLFMRLGAKNLRYKMRFHDDNLIKEMSQNTVKRFIAYTLYTQTVTQMAVPTLQKLEVEIRISLEDTDSLYSEETEAIE